MIFEVISIFFDHDKTRSLKQIQTHSDQMPDINAFHIPGDFYKTIFQICSRFFHDRIDKNFLQNLFDILNVLFHFFRFMKYFLINLRYIKNGSDTAKQHSWQGFHL